MDEVARSYERQALSEHAMGWPSRYAAPQSVDAWRHTRMLDLLTPIIESLPTAKWLTVGDGRYGSDAAFLQSRGADVIASSLTDERLRAASERGFIGRFQAENAEHLSFADQQLDFVLCKEAYHHFPRPPIALYEMLRVGRIGAVLIEPLDNPRLLDGMKSLIKRILRGNQSQLFEPSGNFLYRLNVRELGKLMTAMGGQVMAFKGINDFYHKRLVTMDAQSVNVGSVVSRLGVAVQDVLARLGLMGYGLGCVVAFRERPAAQLLAAMKAHGYTIIELPKNPYV